MTVQKVGPASASPPRDDISERQVQPRRQISNRRQREEVRRREVLVRRRRDFGIDPLVVRPRRQIPTRQRDAHRLGLRRRGPPFRRGERCRHLTESRERRVLDVARVRREQRCDRRRLIRQRRRRIIDRAAVLRKGAGAEPDAGGSESGDVDGLQGLGSLGHVDA